MTPETREELARAMARANGDNPDAMTPTNGGGENAIWQDFAEYADAVAPIIERLVAERVAAETERCAGIADAHKAAWARKHDAAKSASNSVEVRDFQTMMIAAVTIDLAIRSATR